MTYNMNVIKLIDKMFEIAGHPERYEDVKHIDEWDSQYTITNAQYNEFIKWGENYLTHRLNMYSKSAKIEMQWFTLAYGFKIV